MKWFKTEEVRKFTPAVQHEQIEWPSGTFVRTPTGVYFIKGKTKYKVASDRALASWRVTNFGAAGAGALDGYVYGGKLGFRDGTLIEDMATRKVYLISANKRRHIVDPDAFTKYGIDPDTKVSVSFEEAKLHADGEVLK